jgi:hypothetical protein
MTITRMICAMQPKNHVQRTATKVMDDPHWEPGPCEAAPPCHHLDIIPPGLPPPEISKAGQREPPRQAPPPPLPNKMVIKTKTNSWADPKSIWPERLVCNSLPEGIKYMAVIPIIYLPQYPEEVTSYANLWAGLAHGITIPKTFSRLSDA